MKFSELTPSDLAVLRVDAALEDAYPVKAEALGKRRSSVVLAGYAAWLAKRKTPQAERDKSRDDDRKQELSSSPSPPILAPRGHTQVSPSAADATED